MDFIDSDIVLAILGCRKMRHSHKKGELNSIVVETLIRSSSDGVMLDSKEKGRGDHL